MEPLIPETALGNFMWVFGGWYTKFSHFSHNSTQLTSKHVFATLSFIAEIFIFLYVGMDALDIEKCQFISQSPGKSVGISSVLLGLILVGRAAFVFPLSFLSNLLQKSPHVKIDMKQQVTIWWSGLMRGAVSIALAYNQFTRLGHTTLRENAIMIISTILLFSSAQ
ncbi:sodium/hydrogen exchanger 1-like [Arachis stenosperma]|uniref:sodium/hydrogen exchanger 1-like n=1 Tax=Arachis stenosperma TaxID=217475 RepID=UPI0025AD9875|nr:sodium/hydrogen exchanger 1-like [Arachis stenosperma]